MTGSFLDTTVVVNLSDRVSAEKPRSEAIVSANLPSETPCYSLRELLVGHMQNLCSAHSAILAAEDHAEALISISSRLALSGRKKGSTLEAVFNSLKHAFQSNPTGPRDQMKQELLDDLALRINSLWRTAHKIKNVDIVQPLSCFDDCKVDYLTTGELKPSTGTFNCNKDHRCSAAEYMYEDKVSLEKMIEALHPNKVSNSIAGKTETLSRRKALKDLYSNGPNRFNKRGCRALGDAYFAAMCPPDKVVITTNLEDHAPLCSSLGKVAVKP